MSYEAQTLFSLEGRTVLLTGASGFLGRTIAETVLSNGASLAAMGRSERMEEIAGYWADRFGKDRVRPVRVDMTNHSAFVAAVDDLLSEIGTIDVLINNAHDLSPDAGFNTPEGHLEEADLKQVQSNLDGGVLWPLTAIQKVGSGMRSAGRGSIINVASMYGLVAPSPKLYEGTDFLNPPGYSTSKGAMLALTRYVASFWGPYGIRSNALVPGPFSNTQEKGPNTVTPKDPFITRLSERTALGRIGRREELAGAVLFLASDASSFVTGHALVVDGGWTTT